jgi:phosphoribosyl-ATP pyrophosphohydrolase
VIAALVEPGKLASEAADLVFHLLVLLADAGLGLDDIRAELARREGVSGHDEKALR